MIINQASGVIVDCCDEVNRVADLRGQTIEQFKDFLSNWQSVVEAMFE
jgi:hypothetical protein